MVDCAMDIIDINVLKASIARQEQGSDLPTCLDNAVLYSKHARSKTTLLQTQFHLYDKQISEKNVEPRKVGLRVNWALPTQL